uniref:Histone-lysine N-methyltransferase, H3 lysine-79 specific n=1 Tax=Caenorhabditis japonica TaxID=281687 RepID=A0A8R1EDD4_CAEJA
MAHFGKNCGKFELIEGDFLNPKFKKLITEEATVIFINNYAFGPDLMFNITNELLQELKHGTRIVTTKPFGSNKREITYRSTSDITAMSDTVQMRSVEHCVSWTANKVDFWLTTMDHTKLIKYYEDELHKKNSSARDPKLLNSTESTETRSAKRNETRTAIKSRCFCPIVLLKYRMSRVQKTHVLTKKACKIIMLWL